MKLVILAALWVPINIALLIFSLVYLMRYQAKPVNLSFPPIVQAQSLSPASPTQDIRVLALRKFFQDYKSPLADLAEFLVKQADNWGLDYTLMPAIAMQESSGCRKIPVDSYNCWGFGIYSTKITRFASYEMAIEQVAKTIKEAYIKNGYTNPTLLEDKWTPSSRGQWSYSVNFFISKIKEYERNTPAT